jgi:protein gp37
VNKQSGPNRIEWTDYTHNPIGGCKHACRWTMPNGEVAQCYAETTANKVARAAYSQGFDNHYWRPNLLNDPIKVKTPSKIFVGSMSDVFGHWVPDEQIQQVLDVCNRAPQHTFQFLTKNPKRLKHFHFPENAWIGISSPPDSMWGKSLNYPQQTAWLSTSLNALMECDAKVKWMSIEPLCWDIADDLWWETEEGQLIAPKLDWVVIGAASSGKTIYQPKAEWVENLLSYLDCAMGIPVFFKGNLRGNAAASTWREEFPTVTVKQLGLAI